MITALVAVAAGVALALALPPNGLWPLALALTVPFALTARAADVRGAFTVGAAFALGFFAVYVAWLPLSFAEPGLLGPWYWVLHPFMLAVLAAMWGAVTAAARAVGGRGAATLLVLPAYWMVAEVLRATGYFAFPWGTLGYAWLDTPVAQVADVVGVTGLSLIVTVVAALAALPFAPSARGRASARRWAGPVAAVALVAGAWAWGGSASGRHEVPADHTALLVQGNVDPFGRATSAAQELGVHVDLTRTAVARMAAAPDLVVWPEGAVLGTELEGARGEAGRAAIQSAAPTSSFVVGGRARVDGGGANAAYALADGQLLGRYDKHVLVPFGERWPLLEQVPGLYRAVFGLLGMPLLANTVPGSGPDALVTPVGPVGVGICYESVFPTVSAAMTRLGAGVLVVVTNDAWFARGDGARQHLDMGRLRAIENRRWLLRAGNDGVTAVVDPYGRIAAELPRGISDTLAVRFGTSDAVTFYARHADRVPWLVLLSGALATPVAWIARRR